jgi:hypothetical protein
MPEIIECPHCLITVLPSSDDLCPCCSKRITDKPEIVREKISSREESKIIGKIEMMYKFRKVSIVPIVLVAFNTFFRYIAPNAERDSTKWLGLVVLISFALSIVFANYRIKSLRERLARTTTR